MLSQTEDRGFEPSAYCSTPTTPFIIALPEPNLEFSQDEEWCLVRVDDGWQEIRFHDYSELFDVPQLYEYIFYEVLKCKSPEVIRGLLAEQVQTDGRTSESLRVLDLGAGNGMVGEELAKDGVQTLVGADILDSAAHATRRDRPGVYTDYVVADLTALEPPVRDQLRNSRLNALTCVAALGFGDIPIEAFVTAFNLIETGGDVAFNIKEEFLEDGNDSEFAGLIRAMTERGELEVRSRRRYVHRLSTGGTPLHYVAFAGTKRKDVTLAP